MRACSRVPRLCVVHHPTQSGSDEDLQKFHKACRDGRSDVADAMLQAAGNDADVKQRLTHHVDDEGWSCMDVACLYGHLAVCELLAQHGVKAFASTSHARRQDAGGTTMHLAIRGRHLPVCEWILQNDRFGTSIVQGDSKGLTPLHHACFGGSEDICNWLLRSCMEPAVLLQATTVLGDTALHIACGAGREQVVQQLLHGDGAGAAMCTLGLESDKGHTPGCLAWDQEHIGVCDFLVSFTTASSSPSPHSLFRSPIVKACREGRVDLCEWLEYRGLLTTEDIIGPTRILGGERDSAHELTPLDLAAKYGHAPVIEWLCDRGAEVDKLQRQRGSKSPMYYAAKFGHEQALRTLYARGARVPTRGAPLMDVDGGEEGRQLTTTTTAEDPGCRSVNPIDAAFEAGHLSVVQWFCEQRAAPIEESNVMHTACAWGNVALCQFLYDCGAHECVTCLRNGCTSMRIACTHGHIDVCEWLYNHGGNGLLLGQDGCNSTHELYRIACDAENIELCDWLRTHGVDPKREDLKPHLITACAAGRLAVVKWLCTHGDTASMVNVRAPLPFDTDSIPQTPLETASRRGFLNIVTCLHRHGATLPGPSTSGTRDTLLHLACSGTSSASSPGVDAGAGAGAGAPQDKAPSKRLGLVKWILAHDRGRDSINASGQMAGWTPLFLACFTLEPTNTQLLDLLRANGAEDTVTSSREWKCGSIPAPAMLWVLKSFNFDIERAEARETLESTMETVFGMWERASSRLLQTRGGLVVEDEGSSSGSGSSLNLFDRHNEVARLALRSVELPRLLLTLLHLGGAQIVTSTVPTTIPNEVIVSMVEAGVDADLLAQHPHAAMLVRGIVEHRRGFVRSFLFGCRQSSGSSSLWRLGQKGRGVSAKLRRDIAEFAGVLCSRKHFRNVLQVAAVLCPDLRGAGVVGAQVQAQAEVKQQHERPWKRRRMVAEEWVE